MPDEIATPNVETLSNPETFKTKFDQLHGVFTNNINSALETNRATRDMIVDVEALRATKKLLPHQTYLPQLVIDTNIMRALPDHIAYLTQSRRIALFIPNNKHKVPDTTFLETEFHRVMTYDGWITEYTRAADCTKLHGFGHVDVSFDTDCPGHVNVEFIRAGNLMFDLAIKDIQQAPLVIRVYDVTSVDLYTMAADYGFDEKLVEDLNKQITSKQPDAAAYTDNEVKKIYRVFYKEQGKVFTGWYSKHLQKFLVTPVEFWNGVSKQIAEVPPPDPTNPMAVVSEPVLKWVKVPASTYPFHFYLNRITESEAITKVRGSASLDYYMQDAITGIVSGYHNGMTESLNVVLCPDGQDADVPNSPKQLELEIKHGRIWNRTMRAWSMPAPSPSMLQAIDMLKTSNSESTNQISFATNNRKDTRKTATELEMAEKQDSTMSTMSVTTWATFIGSVCNAAWEIVQSEALQGNIVFCADAEDVNNVQLIAEHYKLVPAGTTDYVERMEAIEAMRQDLEIVLPTAAGPAFLEEYFRVRYPNNADKFIQPLQQQQAQSSQALQAAVALLKVAVMDDKGNLLPEWQSQAKTLAQFGIAPGKKDPTTQPQNGTPNTAGTPAGPAIPG